MTVVPPPLVDPPPVPTHAVCDRCDDRVRAAEAYGLSGEVLCLDCAAKTAACDLGGSCSWMPEIDIQVAIEAVENWIAERKATLLSPDAVALRAAIRAAIRDQRRTK